MALIEDAVPPARRRLRMVLRLWWPIVGVVFAGVVAAWYGAADYTARGIQDHRDYTASPICRLPADGSAGGCTAQDRSIGTFRLSEVQILYSGDRSSHDPIGMLVAYQDATGLSDGTASFGAPPPPFSDSPTADESAVIELWQGEPQWAAATGSTDRYPANGSVVVATRYLAAPIMICSALYLLLMCASWWRMAYRGRVCDHEFGRPLVFFAVLTGLGTGWWQAEHWDPAAPAVLAVTLAVATLLGAPWPRPGRIKRAWRARRDGRVRKRGRDAVFR